VFPSAKAAARDLAALSSRHGTACEGTAITQGIRATNGQVGLRVERALIGGGPLPLSEPSGSLRVRFDVQIVRNETGYTYQADVLVFRVGAAEVQLIAAGNGGPSPADERRLSVLLVHRARASRHP
jgi:hypothetical protein